MPLQLFNMFLEAMPVLRSQELIDQLSVQLLSRGDPRSARWKSRIRKLEDSARFEKRHANKMPAEHRADLLKQFGVKVDQQ